MPASGRSRRPALRQLGWRQLSACPLRHVPKRVHRISFQLQLRLCVTHVRTAQPDRHGRHKRRTSATILIS
jgi:hypothetical protein